MIGCQGMDVARKGLYCSAILDSSHVRGEKAYRQAAVMAAECTKASGES